MNGNGELKLEIDAHKLGEEWQNQPYLYWTWAKKAADAQLKHDQAKAMLDVERAELDKEIRDDPKQYGFEKVTEAALSNAILQQKSYQAAVSHVNKMRHEWEIAKAAVNAIDHRKRALEKLVELQIRDLYSTPHVQGGGEEQDEWNKRQARQAGKSRRVEQESGVDDE